MSKSRQFVGSKQTEVTGHSRRTRMGYLFSTWRELEADDLTSSSPWICTPTNTSKRSRMENSRTNFSICQAVTTSRTLRTLDIWRPMTVSDSAGDNFDGHAIEEYTVTPGTNACWWPNSGLTQNPGVSGAVNWAVGYYNGAPGPDNEWGPDAIGWDLQDLDNIVQNGPQNGVTFPCTATIHQGMRIECDANLWYNYTT